MAGWEVTLLDLGAIYAPLTWVYPDAAEDELAWLPSNGLLRRQGEDAVLVDCGLGPYMSARRPDTAGATRASSSPATVSATPMWSDVA